MMTNTSAGPSSPASLATSLLESRSQADWDAKRNDPINIQLGDLDGYYHHHFAVTGFNRGILETQGDELEALILKEMHRLENEQVSIILDAMGDVSPEASVMDAGSGRGGTSYMIGNRFGCHVHGVNFCEHHVEFARDVGRERGWDERVRFHLANMIATPFDGQSMDFVVSNETTMYVELHEAFREFARVLRPGGRYIGVTWCANDQVAWKSPVIETINSHYVCEIHPRAVYFKALADNGLVPLKVANLTADTIPYWELRSHSRLATGIEKAFLEAHSTNALNYIVFVAERAPKG
ncbi:SAM-dependent methyltransferase [Nocardiopsis rhodophaea]|uniref:SAM-dependent methyltransferase n=2 Tax=Nocardiopsis rhodophaea TaxID=280238 RepID=UPI00337D6ACC